MHAAPAQEVCQQGWVRKLIEGKRRKNILFNLILRLSLFSQNLSEQIFQNKTSAFDRNKRGGGHGVHVGPTRKIKYERF